MSRIFLSHSGANDAQALAIRNWLDSEGWRGEEVFLDLDADRGIATGARWERALEKAVNRCEAVLLLISKAWLGSGWCLAEYQLARRLNKRLFGVLIEDLSLDAVPRGFAETWQIVRLAGDGDRVTIPVMLPLSGAEVPVAFSADGLRRLKAALAEAILASESFTWPPANDPGRAPYCGLRPFEAEDAGVFFGRSEAIVQALDQLRGLRQSDSPRFFVILGASGVGKSSFLRAGLIPRLTRDHQNFLPIPVIRPKRAAISGDEGLLEALAKAFVTAGVPARRVDLRTAVQGGGSGLRSLLQTITDEIAKATIDTDGKFSAPTLVISVDQFEELFLPEDQQESEALLALLRDLLSPSQLSLIVICTIRPDYFGHLQHEKLLTEIRKVPFELGPLGPGSVLEIVRGPAWRAQLQFDRELVDTLLTDFQSADANDALPLLSFTLERLWDCDRGGGMRGLQHYHAFGGIRGVIDDAVYRALAVADQDPRIPRDGDTRFSLLRRGLIPWLACLDAEAGIPRRRVAHRDEIPADSAPLIDLLVEQRLLTTSVRSDVGQLTIEPAHDALLRQWGLLCQWLDEDFTALITLDAVERAARIWAVNGRRDEWLNHGQFQLSDAEKVAARSDLAFNLSQGAKDYLRRCHEREKLQSEQLAGEAFARLKYLIAEFFRAAGRPIAGAAHEQLLGPDPVWISKTPNPRPEDVAEFAEFLSPGQRGFIVYQDTLPSPTTTALDRLRAEGKSIVPINMNAIAASLTDANAPVVLAELERSYESTDNLFDTRNAIVDERFFFGRSELLARVGAALARGEHALITGLRKCGKTSFLNILRQHLSSHPVCFVDLQRYDRHLEDWPGELFKLILTSYDSWGRRNFSDWSPAGDQSSRPANVTEFEKLLHSRVWQQQAHGRNERMIIILDEGERVFPASGEVEEARKFARAAGALRMLGQTSSLRSISIIAADLRPWLNRKNLLPDGSTNPFFDFFQEIPLPMLTRDELAELVQVIGRAIGIYAQSSYVDELYSLSGGHPSIARVIAGASCRVRGASTELTKKQLHAGLAALAITDALGYFFRNNLWGLMTREEKVILLAFAKASIIRKASSKLRDLIGMPKIAQYPEALANLYAQGILHNRQIAIGSFREWIRDSGQTLEA